MSANQQLLGRRIAVLVADGFEKLELSVLLKALRGAGARVDIVSLHAGHIRGMNLHEPAGRIQVDRTVQEAQIAEYDALLIPGGFINPDLLRQSAAAREFVRAFDQLGRPIASLCHGPCVLASCGLTAGRALTSWPGVRDDLVNAGAAWLDEAVVRDGNWITSRGPHDLAAFTPALLEFLADEAAWTAASPRPTQSAPQREEPPQAVIKAMQLIPRPSLRTAMGIAAIGAGATGLFRSPVSREQ